MRTLRQPAGRQRGKQRGERQPAELQLREGHDTPSGTARQRGSPRVQQVVGERPPAAQSARRTHSPPQTVWGASTGRYRKGARPGWARPGEESGTPTSTRLGLAPPPTAVAALLECPSTRSTGAVTLGPARLGLALPGLDTASMVGTASRERGMGSNPCARPETWLMLRPYFFTAARDGARALITGVGPADCAQRVHTTLSGSRGEVQGSSAVEVTGCHKALNMHGKQCTSARGLTTS